MPSHTLSFSICVDLELDDANPESIGSLKIDVIDNEGRAAPPFLLRTIREHLVAQDQYENL